MNASSTLGMHMRTTRDDLQNGPFDFAEKVVEPMMAQKIKECAEANGYELLAEPVFKTKLVCWDPESRSYIETSDDSWTYAEYKLQWPYREM